MASAITESLDETAERQGEANAQSIASLRRAFESSYSADRLRPAVARKLAASVSAADVDAALAWLRTDLGVRITDLEVEYSTPARARKRIGQADGLVRGIPEARRAQYDRLSHAIHAAEVSATLIIEISKGVARGLDMVDPGGPSRESLDRLSDALEAQRPRIVAAMEEQNMAFFAEAYATLSDDELERYIVFAESRPGARVQAAMSTALNEAMTDAAVEAGRSAASARSASSSEKSRGPSLRPARLS